MSISFFDELYLTVTGIKFVQLQHLNFSSSTVKLNLQTGTM